jgi:hypothetical protein
VIRNLDARSADFLSAGIVPRPDPYQRMNKRRFTSAAPTFSTELMDWLRAIGCHELAEEIRLFGLGQ